MQYQTRLDSAASRTALSKLAHAVLNTSLARTRRARTTAAQEARHAACAKTPIQSTNTPRKGSIVAEALPRCQAQSQQLSASAHLKPSPTKPRKRATSTCLGAVCAYTRDKHRVAQHSALHARVNDTALPSGLKHCGLPSDAPERTHSRRRHCQVNTYYLLADQRDACSRSRRGTLKFARNCKHTATVKTSILRMLMNATTLTWVGKPAWQRVAAKRCVTHTVVSRRLGVAIRHPACGGTAAVCVIVRAHRSHMPHASPDTSTLSAFAAQTYPTQVAGHTGLVPVSHNPQPTVCA